MICKLNPEGWERKGVGEKVFQKERLTHTAVWNIAVVSAYKKSLNFLVRDIDVFMIRHLLARIYIFVSNLSPLLHDVLHLPTMAIYCVHRPEFLSQICFLINWYWSFKTQIKGQLLLLPQVGPITSSFVTRLYLDNLLQVSKPLHYIPIECRSWRVAYISYIISQNRVL